jgi:DNA-directed RNA polymerase
MAYDGGYYLSNESLIRTGLHGHTADLPDAISDTTLDALNAIQATPWRINTFVLDIMREAWLSGDLLGGLPSAEPMPLPPRMDDDVWSALSDDGKRAHKLRLAEVHGHNASAEGGRAAFLDKLTTAEKLRDRDAIWFPHTLDFRGRIYPVAGTGPHPQSDGFGRALLMFAEGKPLGDTGLYWLMVRAANTYGQDKLELDARVKWAEENLDAIIDSARNPLDGGRFWAQTEEDPWSFLATCHEIAQAFDLADPTTFVSHLPIPMDGTCNGLQHLSAMGRDPVGAEATNLTASGERRDIYVEVAKVVARMVSDDALKGDDMAISWAGRVTRAVVKRAVMTTPYGVTSRGIRDQLLADGHVDGERENRSKRADYLRDKIVDALSQTVTAAKDIMAWLQAVARELARHQVPFDFTTPTGNRIRQSYYTLTRRVVQTLMGELVLWEEEKRAGLDARKQSLAAAPNFIHAFDAAHLVVTVNAAAAQGVTSFCMIHDSYGTHAADTTRLAAILRETFVLQYADRDWLAEVEADVSEMCPVADLPPRPALGTFDVTEVRQSPFFFS